MFTRFDPDLRVHATWPDLQFLVLPELMKEGAGFLADVQERRKDKALKPAERGYREPLKTREPW